MSVGPFRQSQRTAHNAAVHQAEEARAIHVRCARVSGHVGSSGAGGARRGARTLQDEIQSSLRLAPRVRAQGRAAQHAKGCGGVPGLCWRTYLSGEARPDPFSALCLKKPDNVTKRSIMAPRVNGSKPRHRPRTTASHARMLHSLGRMVSCEMKRNCEPSSGRRPGATRQPRRPSSWPARRRSAAP